LQRLVDAGNTVVVVEHDMRVVAQADWVIDIGPGAGKRGGNLVAQGGVAALAAAPDSTTGRFLARPMIHPLQPRRPVRPARAGKEAEPAQWLTVHGAHLHNLRDVTARIPL
ncbi:excinuclease ABC subunit UvrA, partial [Klebsiella pneumoniae]|nr:excinuclease ABC subunit UvrA [Klebsiella pneumoniae]